MSQTFGIVYHDTNGQNHGAVSKTQSFLLKRNLYGHPLAGLLWERQFEKILLQQRLGEGFQLGMLNRTPSRRVILICVCGWHKIDWKETEHWSDVESTQQRSRFGRTNIFPWSCTLGLHSKSIWNKERYCGQLQSHNLNREFPREEPKNFHTLKILVFPRGLTTWKVMTRNVWNDLASWQTRRLNNSTKYLLHASMTTTLKKKKWNLLENCQKYHLKLFWILGTNWKNLIFHGQWTNLHDRLQNGQNACIDWFHTFITHCEYKQNCYVGNTAKQCRLGLFQYFNFAGDLEDSKATSGGNIVRFWKSYICSDKLDV